MTKQEQLQVMLKHYPLLIARCRALASAAAVTENMYVYQYWTERWERHIREYEALLVTIKED